MKSATHSDKGLIAILLASFSGVNEESRSRASILFVSLNNNN